MAYSKFAAQNLLLKFFEFDSRTENENRSFIFVELHFCLCAIKDVLIMVCKTLLAGYQISQGRVVLFVPATSVLATKNCGKLQHVFFFYVFGF